MPAKATKLKKLKWTDAEDIAFRLIDKYPDTNPKHKRLSEIQNYVTQLPDFGDNPKKVPEGVLETIQTTWYEERQDMEDELGPLSEVAEDDDLDEDEYRDDKMIDELEEDEPSVMGEDEDDEEEEDEFGEGFHEEEAD